MLVSLGTSGGRKYIKLVWCKNVARQQQPFLVSMSDGMIDFYFSDSLQSNLISI